MSLYTIIHGQVNRDPFYRTGENGKQSFLNLNVECGDRYKTYLKVMLFGDVADKYSQTIQDGDWIIATGNSLRANGYTKQSGELGADVTMYASTFQVVDSVGAGNNAVENATAEFSASDF